MKTDPEIRQAVVNALSWDEDVPRMEVLVQVSHGVVTLVGTVANPTQRAAAEAAARSVAGVRDVVNDVVARLPMTSVHRDEKVIRAVRHALERDPLVPHERISVTVADAWVTLSGSVDVADESKAAVGAAEHAAGVMGVTNMLALDGSRLLRPARGSRRRPLKADVTDAIYNFR